jgi:Mn-dependent DtxR family transcriptional regulator
MSQDETILILQELGGKATSSDIRRKAKEKFPRQTLWQYTGQRLTKLEKSNLVKKTDDGAWELTDAGRRYIEYRKLGQGSPAV